jgi:hypothetical protein
MPPPLPPNRPLRQPSKPDVPGTLTGVEQPERRAVRHHSGVDGAPQELPPHKRSTLTGMPAQAAPDSAPPPPAPPALPLEFAPTRRPPLPWGRTVRAPTPPEVVAAARRSDPPPHHPTPVSGMAVEPQVIHMEPPSRGQPGPSLPPPSADPKDAQIAALRARAEAAERRAAESKAPASEPAKSQPAELVSDEAIGRVVRHLGAALMKRVGAPTALLVLLGGGGYALKTANEKPAPPPVTLAELDDRLEKLKKRKGGLDDIARGQNGTIKLLKCLRRKQNQIGESMLPAPDHMGSVRKPQPYDDDCGDPPSLLPDPDQ